MESKAPEEEVTLDPAPKETLEPSPKETLEPSPKEIALSNLLNDLQEEYKKLKQELKQVKISNEELSIKIGIDNPKTELLRNYSKYTRSDN